MADYYVKEKFKAKLVDANRKTLTEILWGDPVHLLAPWSSDSIWANVRVRGRAGWVRKKYLKKKSANFKGLLEFYVMDVGQGDGVLLRTPDDKWHVIDAGLPNSRQMTKKGAPNFIRWKFYRDLRKSKIKLHSMTASHPDLDHYGGMIDLLSEQLFDGRTFKIDVDHFYHTGMGRFKGTNPLGRQHSGAIANFPLASRRISKNDKFITELLDDLDSFENPPRPFTDDFADLAELLVEKCGSASRLSLADEYMPGYAPNENEVEIKILGPIVEKFGNKEGLRRLGSGDAWASKTRNGHSIVYRFDYGKARIMMNGDLNAESQRLLLTYVEESEFAVDVAKGCHHGSSDVHIDFIKAMKARATVISSGDNESYAHPKPVIIGASARYGRESRTPNNKICAPLIYSTELARSVKLEYATSLRYDSDGDGPKKDKLISAKKTKIKTKSIKYRPLKHAPVNTDLIYGLINIRTDGDIIMVATMKEAGNTFDKKYFQAGVDVELE